MLKITEEQVTLFLKHLPDAIQCIESGDIDTILDILDAKITEIGFSSNYELNAIGVELQKLYDELYNQN